MSRTYWDTSCVLPLYVAEPSSAEVVAWASCEPGALTSSCILELEFLFALQAKVTYGQLSGRLADRAREQFLTDIDKERFLLVPLGRDVARYSSEVSKVLDQRLTGTVVRTLDGIHLATALHLGCAKFVTADDKLARFAAAAGMDVAHPGR